MASTGGSAAQPDIEPILQAASPPLATPRWRLVAVSAALAVVVSVGGIVVALVNVNSGETATPVMSATYAPIGRGDECSLLSDEVIAIHAPKATCELQSYAGANNGDDRTHAPRWTVTTPGTPHISIAVTLTLTTDAPRMLAAAHDTTAAAFTAGHTSPSTKTPVIGDEAYLLLGRSALTPSAFDARLLVRAGNAYIDVSYRGFASVAGSEAAAKAISVDLIGNLRRA
ncbi:hypothetical protein ACWDOP_02830 [Nocardia sp. NPDC003693]